MAIVLAAVALSPVTAALPRDLALSPAVVRHALIPMLVGYLLVMIALGLGLLRLRHERAVDPRMRPYRGDRPAAPRAPARPGGSGSRASDGPADRVVAPAGWPAFLRHLAGTALGGYLVLMAVVLGYYYGVARVAGNFLASAVTGPVLLILLTLPLYTAIAWLTARHHRRGSSPRS